MSTIKNSKARGSNEGSGDEGDDLVEEQLDEQSEEQQDATREKRLAGDLGELEEELDRIRKEADDARDRALRTLAEFDNYRKRNERERREAVEMGAAGVLRDLLEVADNFDRALEHAAEGAPPAFVEGMKLIARGFHDILDRRGVKRIETTGKPFDPHVHEALASEPTEQMEPNRVLREVQPGYLMGDRVLRPAKVVVSRANSR
ncbi:MAG TPA: nucleotide exchange factor GrpE [bacterium]|nr:nucleotide exchange factor GrpE [bacterium]